MMTEEKRIRCGSSWLADIYLAWIRARWWLATGLVLAGLIALSACVTRQRCPIDDTGSYERCETTRG